MLILTSLLLSLLSAFFISKANLGLSAKIIAKLASTKFGYNSDIIKSLAEQNSDNWAGILLLVIAIVTQGISAFILLPTGLTKITLGTFIMSVIISSVVYLLFQEMSKRRASKLIEQAVEIKKTQSRNKSALIN